MNSKRLFIILMPFFLVKWTDATPNDAFFKKLDNLVLDDANFSLVPNLTFPFLDQMYCFKVCLENDFCSYVNIKNDKCTLHTYYAKKRLIHSNESFLFNKTIIKKNCEKSPCMNAATCENKYDGYNCICPNEYLGINCTERVVQYQYKCNSSFSYYSLSKNACVECPNNFISLKEYPLTCYNFSSLNTTFTYAKKYCMDLGSYIIRPKSITERKALNENFKRYLNLISNPNIWVDSEINYIGQPFMWGDETTVYGFRDKEPNNNLGNNDTFLREKYLALNTDSLFDYGGSAANVICQIGD